MPFETKELDHGLGSLVIATGEISEEEYLSFYRALLTSGTEVPQKQLYNIPDYTAVTKAEISPKAIERIAQLSIQSSTENSFTITAVIANQDLIFGLARMWENMASQATWDINVFRNRNDAEAWILERAKANDITDELTFK